MLLSRQEIFDALNDKKLSFGKPVDVSGSSVDLTVDKIYIRDCLEENFIHDELSDRGLRYFEIQPGGTALVQVKEELRFSQGLGGILFPPNRLSKNGLLMTNPGHIDPGYNGGINVCLINMGVSPIAVKRGDAIATLLIFRVSPGAGKYEGRASVGVTHEHLSRLGDDFANLTQRSRDAVRSLIYKHLLASISIFGVIIAVVLGATPVLADWVAKKTESLKSEDFSYSKVGFKNLEAKDFKDVEIKSVLFNPGLAVENLRFKGEGEL